MANYTNVHEDGNWMFATYRGYIDVCIERTAVPHATAYLPGGYPLTRCSYVGYTWCEVKREFKVRMDEEIEKLVLAQEGGRR